MSGRDPTATRLLIVDDDPVQCGLLARIFSARSGRLRVLSATGGEAAVTTLEAGPFDAVLTDLQMPGTNGFALVEWLRQHRPHVRVFTMTAYPHDAAVRDLAARGAIECFTKPLDVAYVIERIVTEPISHAHTPPPEPAVLPASALSAFPARMPADADALAVALVDTSTGRICSAAGQFAELEAIAAMMASIHRSQARMAKQLQEQVHEVVVTTRRTWFMSRPLPTSPESLALLVFDPRRANVVLERLALEAFVADFCQWRRAQSP